MRPQLPIFYYWQHFKDFLGHIKCSYGSILTTDEHEWIEAYTKLSRPAQCLVARIANRITPFIHIDTLNYDEIPNRDDVLTQLHTAAFVEPINDDQALNLVPVLTKPELMSLGQHLGLSSIKPSHKKSQLVDTLLTEAAENKLALNTWPSMQHYTYRCFDTHLRYFLFLYFGKPGARLTQFSLRDLGISHTRSGTQPTARFNNKIEAKSGFYYATLNHHKREGTTEVYAKDLPEPQGDIATHYQNRYCLYQATTALDDAEKLAFLKKTTSPEGFEKYVRLLYKTDQIEHCENLLIDAIDNPRSDLESIFAQDFYERKFNKKRTSIYTELLKQSAPPIILNEYYRHQVERGLVAYYKKRGAIAFQTENNLWRALFVITFWPLLFETKHSTFYSEFDRIPSELKENRFYTEQKTHIEALLDKLQTYEQYQQHVDGVLERIDKIHTPLFFWHTDLPAQITCLIQSVNLSQLGQHLRAMAHCFSDYSNGYPDIMVIDQDGLRFEEVKAPGDTLRKNQLIMIERLKHIDIDVCITRTQWNRNYNDRYAVVDIETTGSNKPYHRITEVGIVIIENQTIVERWNQLINPERNIPANITRLTNITNDMVANAPTFVEVADEIEAKLEGCIFVAHNVNFDYGFIRNEFGRINRHLNLPKLCTVRESRRNFKGLSSYSLKNLSHHFTINLTNHHRALADAEAAAEILLKNFQVEQCND